MTGQKCSHEVADHDGILGPCDRPVSTWRWYESEEVGHDSILSRVCEWHGNEAGKRMGAALKMHRPDRRGECVECDPDRQVVVAGWGSTGMRWPCETARTIAGSREAAIALWEDQQ